MYTEMITREVAQNRQGKILLPGSKKILAADALGMAGRSGEESTIRARRSPFSGRDPFGYFAGVFQGTEPAFLVIIPVHR